MLPDNTLSTTPVPQPFLPPRDYPPQQLVDYEMGGVGLQNPSQGLQVKIWRCRYLNGQDFVLDADNVADTVVLSKSEVSEFSFTFDQNMNVCIAYVDAAGANLYWYDATISSFVTLSLPGAVTPKVALDDKRSATLDSSDIILAYIKSGNLYYRQQRDRFTVERLLAAGAGPGLRRIGMGLNWRFLFEIQN
jgi:hypothetical protein